MRTTTKTLGVIIVDVMAETLSTWQVPPKSPATTTAIATVINDKVKAGDKGNGKGKSRRQRKRFNANRNASQREQTKNNDDENGKAQPCEAWNKGKCTNGACPQRKAHKCNNTLANGAMCGNKGHRAINCWRK